MCYYGSSRIALRNIQKQSQELCRKMLTSLDTIKLIFSNSTTMLRYICSVCCFVSYFWMGFVLVTWQGVRVSPKYCQTGHRSKKGVKEWKFSSSYWTEFLGFGMTFSPFSIKCVLILSAMNTLDTLRTVYIPSNHGKVTLSPSLGFSL